MSRPPVHHDRAPQSHPHDRPRPTKPSSHLQTRRLCKYSLHNHANAHAQEEPASSDKFRPIPKRPQADMMKDGGHNKCAHDGAGPPQERASGTGPKDDKIVSPELVPAETPKLLNRSGHPWLMKGGRPRGGWLAKNDPPDQRCKVIRKVYRRVNPNAADDAAECGQSGARHESKARVEDTATLGIVYCGADVLEDVLRSVQNGQ